MAAMTKRSSGGNAMTQQQTTVHDVEIVKVGEQLVIPEAMTLDDAIKTIERRKMYEEESVAINVPLEAFLMDGAVALHKAMSLKFGWTQMIPTPGFWGPEPPTMMGVQVDVNTIIQVPWGRMKIPGVEGYIETSATKKNGRFIFQIGGVVKRKHERQVQDIIDLTRKFLREESIYRAKAIRIRFKDDNGEELKMPEPKFLDLGRVRDEELIYSEHVESAVITNLFMPVERTADVRRFGVPLKRGVLLAGNYGTGKTLAAFVTAKKATANDWTFVLCERADELPDILRFAQQYAPCVVFCEDIDRVTAGNRSIDMDSLLNIVDGIESKTKEIMVVFTTNDVNAINKAMLRPGRLDAVINIEEPDAGAVERLIRLYGRGLVPETEDLTLVGKTLAGNIPAVIREAVERAKLSAVRWIKPGGDLQINSKALLDAAQTMQMQLDLLKPETTDTRTAQEKAASILAEPLKQIADRYPANGGNGHDEHSNGEIPLLGAATAASRAL